ncbi:MAG: hypothetical protein IJB19_00220 [Clostridia bacterium]|nr:hypothetical protein [Clostridia bacterium]
MKITIEKKPNTKKRFKEFSKKALAAMIVLWFIGAAVVIAVVLTQVVRGDLTVNTTDLTTYICTPMTGGVLGYMLKSAVENKEKIKGNIPEREEYIA